MTLALAGNQNAGKTTLFNALTGFRRRTGNFPGVTVDCLSGEMRGYPDWCVTDLPGLYSLRPYTPEEMVARDFLLGGQADGIINVVDAENLTRNLYLTWQILSCGRPTVIALNRMDAVRAAGGHIDTARLSSLLGVPVLPISAARGEGLGALCAAAVRVVQEGRRARPLSCAPGVENCLRTLETLLPRGTAGARFFAEKWLEEDADALARLSLSPDTYTRGERACTALAEKSGAERSAAMADARYRRIERITAACVTPGDHNTAHRRSLAADRLLCGRLTAFPVFFLLMAFLFYMTFHGVGGWLSARLGAALTHFNAQAAHWMSVRGVSPPLISLLTDGVFSGIGAVLSFLPPLLVLFFFLSLLEDSGYMARVAFIMDRPMRRLGLSGRSLVPLLLGFGCSVPAVMATRTVPSARDRRMTVFLIPFMSCSAKLPIYAVFAAAFFPGRGSLLAGGLYIAGVLCGIGTAAVLRRTRFAGEGAPFLLELPDYRWPTPRSTARLLWEKARDFLSRAFTVVFLSSLVIWFLCRFGPGLSPVSDSSDSLLAHVGRWFSPLFAPLGFGDWRAVTALLSGLAAKETVVSTLSVLLPRDGGAAALASLFSPRAAVSFLLFTLLYTPCAAAVAAARRELGTRRATLAFALLPFAAAWVVAFLFYTVSGWFC